MKIKRKEWTLLTVLLLFQGLAGCSGGPEPLPERHFREDMRMFVTGISAWAKFQNSEFKIIPQNGVELFTLNGEHDGEPAAAYLNAIDGQGQEDLYYGYTGDGLRTPAEATARLEGFLDIAARHGVKVLVTNYVKGNSPAARQRADDARARSRLKGYLNFSAPSRGLDCAPEYPDPLNGTPAGNIVSLNDAGNFLYLINPDEQHDSKAAFLSAVMNTNYDLVLIDPYYEGEALLPEDVTALKTKAGGGRRLVIAYMSIGEAEDYRYYWHSEWDTAPPAWLGAENPRWKGNYKVEYWNRDWQDIIFGSAESCLGRILSQGFDGVYLDIVDAFEYYEQF
ncbi:MAG: hypothetical protein CSA76_04795 [Spirochaetales bacterium]|nr:MAG: hypothetical protein CSA76_04795 [Spirochaetales bacterium]